MPKVIAKVQAHYLRMLAPLLEGKPERYELAGVHIEPCEAGGLLIVTNGHIMGVILDTEAKVSKSGTYRLPDALPYKDLDYGDMASFDGTQVEINDIDGDETFIGLAKKLTTGYPDWRKSNLWPQGTPRFEAWQFNPKYLACLTEVAAGSSVHFTSYGAKEPIIIRAHNTPEFIGVLMSMRGDEPTVSTLPSWLGLSSKQAA